MSERLTTGVVFTRTVERVEVSKEPIPNEEGYFDYALIGDPRLVREWLKDAPFSVLGPWVGALIEGDAPLAAILVRSKGPLVIPQGLRRFAPEAARGMLGVWAGR
jgi:hypothetical protein